MRRETRINLIFLITFVVFALPGAVILFRKKLDPTAHRLDQPDPVLHRLPYMSPLPAPPDIKWVVPDRTQAWVESLTAPVPTLSAGPPGPQWDPVISADHLLQLLSVRHENSATHLALLLWSDIPAPRSDALSVSVDGSAANVTGAKAVALPAKVRRELVTGGFVRPPKEVVMAEVEVPRFLTPGPHRLELTYSGPDPSVRTALEFRTPQGVADGHKPGE